MENEASIEPISAEDWTRKLWWAVPAAVFLFLVMLAAVFGKRQEPAAQRTSYDPSAEGFRAAYLLLEELGYPVARSKRLAGGTVRLVLDPSKTIKDAERLDGWVRGGGVLILADISGDFARRLGIPVQVHTIYGKGSDQPVSTHGISRLALGITRVAWPGQPGDVWITAGDEPVITTYTREDGEIWLINCPEVFANRLMLRGDNGVLLCRLVEEVMGDRPGTLLFDEYFHGMRDRPGVMELLFEPPAIWVTLQGLLLIGLLLWHYAPRFGGLSPVRMASRRSKEEFLDAMASLLDRKRDYAEAFRTVRDGLLREIEHALGHPAGTPVEHVARDAAQRRSMSYDRLRSLLTLNAPPGGGGPNAFLKALHELESIRDEFFRDRCHR